MENKKKILGIPMAMFIVGLLVIGGASAALVTYLSNTAEMDVVVTSPMSVAMAVVEHGAGPISAINNVGDLSGDDWSTDLTAPSITALSTLELGFRVKNLADVTIADKTLEIVASNDESNAACADLTSLTFIDVGCSSGTTCYQTVQELAGAGLCSNNGDGTATYSIPINSLAPETTYKYPVTMTFGNVDPAVYNFEATLVE